jgi:predicted GNAT family acetyltransferase
VTRQAVSRKQIPRLSPTFIPRSGDSLGVEELKSGREAEVLAFLAERAVHTVMLAGLVRDNGLASPFNRGIFYSSRDAAGRLEGVILVGEIMMLEARTERALAAFARLAQHFPTAFMLIGEQEKIARFWKYYASAGQAPRLFCRELLYELIWPVEVKEPVPELRLATSDDLDAVLPIHARMALEESGVNPLDMDPDGFRQRCRRRIEQERVWVWIENGQVTFKADIIADTPEVIYLEGVYINPAERGKGYGLRCLSQLSRDLLSRTKAICLLVNKNNGPAHELYRKAGYQLTGLYDTIFLQQTAR